MENVEGEAADGEVAFEAVKYFQVSFAHSHSLAFSC